MTQLSLNKVENEVFLRTSIMDNVRDVKNIMKADSVQNFKHYAVLMKQIEPMLKLKADIMVVESRKKFAKRDLEDCMNKIDRANSELRKDPTRNFTGSKRRR